MSVQTILLIELALDIILLLVIAVAFWQIIRRDKSFPHQLTKGDFEEFKRLINESDRMSNQFMISLNEGRDMLKSLVYTLDEREARLRDLLRKAESLLDQVHGEGVTRDPDGGERYREALKMIEQGLSDEEISQKLGLTSGEIELIQKIKNINPRDSR